MHEKRTYKIRKKNTIKTSNVVCYMFAHVDTKLLYANRNGTAYRELKYGVKYLILQCFHFLDGLLDFWHRSLGWHTIQGKRIAKSQTIYVYSYVCNSTNMQYSTPMFFFLFFYLFVCIFKKMLEMSLLPNRKKNDFHTCRHKVYARIHVKIMTML